MSRTWNLTSDERRHPVASLLNAAASGYVPSSRDLDELKLPDDARKKLRDAADSVAETKRSGANSDASDLANDSAAEILGALPEELRDPDYLREPEPEVTDPRGLADQVPRGW